MMISFTKSYILTHVMKNKKVNGRHSILIERLNNKMSLKRGFGSNLVFLMILAICGVALGATGLLAQTQGKTGPVGLHEQIIEHANNTDIEVYYPVTRNKKINKKLATFAAREVADFKKNLPAEKSPSGIRNQLDITFKTYQYSSNIKTFKVYLFGYTMGQAHPWDDIVTKTYDLAKGKELSLADIFKKNSAYLQELSEQSIRSLIMQMPNGDQKLIREGAAPKAGNFERFALTEKELIIFFNTYQVGTCPEGSPEVKLPYAGLKSFIGPDSGTKR